MPLSAIPTEATSLVGSNRRNSSHRRPAAPNHLSTRTVTLTVVAIAAVALFLALLLPNENDDAPLSAFQQKSVALLWTKQSSQKKKHQENVENKERFYHDQLVDHFSDDVDNDSKTWSNRYYQSTRYFGGRGHPIFVILGGEGAIDDGFLYPFVTDHLAKRFHAAVLQIEHRFYGPYTPVENATVHQLLKLLTPHQAMADTVRLTRHVQLNDFDCSPHRGSKHYCPVITVGGSYPGALSAFLRLVYPDFVDMAYAASAPLLMYAQALDVANPNVYYDIVTDAADRTSPGCANAVKSTLEYAVDTIQSAKDLHSAAETVGICTDSLPVYLKDRKMLSDAIVQIASFKFADANMMNYPPGPDTDLYQTCQIFQQQPTKTQAAILTDFLISLMPASSDNNESAPSLPSPSCFDLMTQIPKGTNTTLEDTDGDYNDGQSWDFQTCTELIFVLGFSEYSMFPAQAASYEQTSKHCRQRFGVTPRPYELVEQWGFDDLSSATSYILFTNGLQDMWSGGSYLWNVSDTVLAFNFENGAHHSDLTHTGPSDRDTDDIKEGHVLIEQTLAKWLKEIQ